MFFTPFKTYLIDAKHQTNRRTEIGKLVAKMQSKTGNKMCSLSKNYKADSFLISVIAIQFIATNILCDSEIQSQVFLERLPTSSKGI